MKNEKVQTIQIDGVKYDWSIAHQPTWENSTQELLGLAISVRLTGEESRELILHFDVDRNKGGEMTHNQKLRVSNKRLIECIQNAIKAGWEPDSRGKRFRFNAGSVN